MRILRYLVVLFSCAAAAQVTPNIGLNLPNPNSPNWNIPLNNNFSLLDSYLSAVSPIPALRITGGLTLSAVSGLTQCLHVNSSGLVSGSGSDCSSGAITGITTAAGSGLMGGGSSGTLTISLINSCSANQVLQWDGANWGCATVTGTGTVTNVSGTANQIVVTNGTTTPVIGLINPLITPGPVAIPAGLLTTDIRPLGITWTENASGTVFNGVVITLVDTAHSAGSKVFQLFGGIAGTTALFQVDNSGNATIPGTSTASALQAIGTGAGADIMTQGAAPTCVGVLPCWPVNSAGFYADPSIATTYALKLPSAGPSAPGFISFGATAGTPAKSALAFNTNLSDVGNQLVYSGGNGIAGQAFLGYTIGSTPGSTYNVGNAGCVLASHQVGDCPTVAAGQQMIGVLATQIGGVPALIVEGTATVNSSSSQTWARAHIVCTDPSNAAVFVDNGTTPCPSGQAQAGIVAVDNTGSTHTIVVEIAPPSAGGFNSPMTTQGDIIYENAVPTAARLAGPTTLDGTPQTLVEQSTSGSAGNPSWVPGGVPIDGRVTTTEAICGTTGVPGGCAGTDRAHFITFSNTSPIAVSLSQAGTTGFANDFAVAVGNRNTGLVTVTPATSTINTNATAIIPNQWFGLIYSNNTNYIAPIMPTIGAFPDCHAAASALIFTAATGAITCNTLSGSGTVNSGTATHLAYYASSTTAVSDMGADFTFTTHTLSGGASAILDMTAGQSKVATQAAKDNTTNAASTAYVDRATGFTAGTSVTLSTPRQYFVCTSTCTITVPVPAAGDEFCVLNDDNVSTVITLAAIGSSARYENTARTAYGTAGTGTFISGGAVGDKVCILGRDSTHYLTVSFNGSWTAN